MHILIIIVVIVLIFFIPIPLSFHLYISKDKFYIKFYSLNYYTSCGKRSIEKEENLKVTSRLLQGNLNVVGI